MGVYVVDASVAAMWFIRHEHSEAALSILDGGQELHAPDFFLLEVNAVFCKWIRRGVIGIEEGSDFRAALSQRQVRLHPFPPLLNLAYTIANWTRRALYDCLYVALAVFLKGRMVTADRRFFNALAGGPFARFVCWVEDAD